MGSESDFVFLEKHRKKIKKKIERIQNKHGYPKILRRQTRRGPTPPSRRPSLYQNRKHHQTSSEIPCLPRNLLTVHLRFNRLPQPTTHGHRLHLPSLQINQSHRK